VGEFDLIERLSPFLSGAGDQVLVGAGDDAAVLRVRDGAVCVTVDVLVEGVHFRRDLSSLADVGWKAVAVSCSDVAAMGGRPTAAVVGLCRPASLPESQVEELYTGMGEACARWGLRLVGGDTVAADALALSVTVLGSVDQGGGVRRDGAQVGDRLVVVGALGAAATALAQVAAGVTPEPSLLAAHRRPIALVAAGQALAAGGATALIDVSDGLGADLGHICRASGVAARVDAEALPVADGVAHAARALDLDLDRLVCGGGEDFALLAAVPAERAREVAATAGAADDVAAAVVGEVVAVGNGPTVVLVHADGGTVDLTGYGYDHYPRAGS
jgi:thiamine-monophosphate kinase